MKKRKGTELSSLFALTLEADQQIRGKEHAYSRELKKKLKGDI